jgi:hypothetical protein
LRETVKSATVSSLIPEKKRFAHMDTTELAKPLTIPQDIEAIEQLKAEYCDICDDDHNQDRIVTIFIDPSLGLPGAIRREKST